MPTTVTKIIDPDNGSGTDYTSLSAWEAGMQKDLVSADEISVAKCRCTGGTADTAVEIDGWTTDATRYIKIWTDPSESYRHNGTFQTGNKFRCVWQNNSGIHISEDFVRIDGIQFNKTHASSNYQSCIYIHDPNSNSNLFISNCVMKLSGETYYPESGVIFDAGAGCNGSVWNCIIYNNGGPSNDYSSCIGLYVGTGQINVYSCTLIAQVYGIRLNYGTPTLVVKNTYASGGTAAYSGTITKTNCASADATADGTSPQTNISLNTSNFVNVTAGSENFHLPSGSALIGVGVDTSGESSPLNFTTDIDGQTRSGSWDIGADEYVSTATENKATKFAKPAAIMRGMIRHMWDEVTFLKPIGGI